MVERKSGVVEIGQLDRCGATETTARLKQLEAMVDTVCYFATPHHAWERGRNENVNGLVRQTLNKGVSMAHLTQRDCQQIADKLNRQPRKRLGFRTPEEVYAQ